MDSETTDPHAAPGPNPPLGDVALVVNGGSRKGREAGDHARDLLVAAGAGDVRLYAAPDGSRLLATLDEAVASDPDLLVVGGGDGSVGAAAGRVSGTRTMLGVLPLGTANDFARTLEIPSDLDGAVAAIVEGRVVDIDLGRAGGHPYLNVASMGLSVATTERLTPGMKRRLGPLAYPVAAARAYRGHEPFSVRIEFPEGDHPVLEVKDVLQVAVGNGRHYGGGYTVAPGAGIDDGMLDVYCIEKGKLRDHLSIARLFKTGDFVEHEKVHHAITTTVHVITDRPLPVNLDGEVVAATPLTFSVERNAVHVVVPRTSRNARWDG